MNALSFPNAKSFFMFSRLSVVKVELSQHSLFMEQLTGIVSVGLRQAKLFPWRFPGERNDKAATSFGIFHAIKFHNLLCR